MTYDGVATARAVLDRLEAGIAAGDLSLLSELCAGDVVLFGSSRASFGHEETVGYLELVAQANTIKWLLDRWSVIHQDDEQLLVAAVGQVEFDDGTGPQRADFRLTLWLVREDGEWRLRHFHGSVPAA
ncbi:hypothetical protein NSZ01_20840 [Nocardioides szechwanensis]|uniref:SnoaL-like domain-containing protein n=1 Tax=Nocardioides szechwanensis TaxID=1005944 RepID=A0A1H0HX43_9ACTN|nr:nuclear transport factor 2 family protein [Nocardioides szechwanensis]GEP34316.1 hypothetical protein NSZ01_20840 [Nocardioides szechwanensis]SDO23776.1 SnoaL-like domain-containing protein [Nocardioides szechwanensis]